MTLDDKSKAQAEEAARGARQAGASYADQPSSPPPRASTSGDSQRGPHQDLAGQAGLDKADAWNKGEDIQHKRSPDMDQALDKVKNDPDVNKTKDSLRQAGDDWLKSGKDSAMSAGEKAGVRSADGESRFNQSPGQARQQEPARGR